ncbi:cystatin-like [Hoplias malabaricus]|uniref:cystatin-like n=1 Tax=Hoplias malabaricus TaxID=27720 RepID=UPI0034635CD6
MFVKLLFVVLALSLAMESSGMPGGLMDADMNNADVQKALQFAVDEYNNVSNGIWVSKVTRVIRGQNQVVAGIKYIFTVEMARTSCKKREQPTEACEVHSDPNIAQSKVCRLAVWSQSWLNRKELVENTCL